eukprot:SM000094S24701  [mRNA]  locus=s94:305242:307157:+ [translate_table: standard]
MQKAVESVRGVFKPRLTPQQQHSAGADIQREETGVRKSIKDAAKRNDLTSAKVRPPAAVRLAAPAPSPSVLSDYCMHAAGPTSASWLTPTHLAACTAATVRAVGHLQKSAEVMKLVNGLVKAPEVSAQMQELSQELMKAGVMEEMVSESIDSALDTDEIEEETEEEVDKVLSEIAGETAAQLPSAARREREEQLPAKQQQVVEKQAEELLAEAGGGDGSGDAAELEALRARFNSVRT